MFRDQAFSISTRLMQDAVARKNKHKKEESDGHRARSGSSAKSASQGGTEACRCE